MRTTIRVLQEEWGVFQNLPATADRFARQTGIDVEVTLSSIPELWELMERSFSGEDPPFDLVGVDDLLLVQAARSGQVEPLDGLIAADDYSLADFPTSALDAVTDRGRLWGLPYCHISNVVIYRADLFEQHGVAVPETLDQLTEAALAIQQAVRGTGTADFYGIALRGAPSCGLNFWEVGSTWAPSYGVRWYGDDGMPTLDTPELRAAVEHYIDLIQRAGPPDSAEMGFAECMACYGSGRAAMTIEPANEASILYDGGGQVAEATRTALIPAGPLGTRHAGLYCPPYAIPARAHDKKAAWLLAKFLCAPDQVLDDALRSGFVEVARDSLFDDPRFNERFRPDLVRTTVQTRPVARGERPVTRHGMEIGNAIGDEVARALRREISVSEALQNAQRRAAALGPRD
jgi:ABC-type glycerol-3-phosphate transport system substrate-binding protein